MGVGGDEKLIIKFMWPNFLFAYYSQNYSSVLYSRFGTNITIITWIIAIIDTQPNSMVEYL